MLGHESGGQKDVHHLRKAEADRREEIAGFYSPLPFILPDGQPDFIFQRFEIAVGGADIHGAFLSDIPRADTPGTLREQIHHFNQTGSPIFLNHGAPLAFISGKFEPIITHMSFCNPGFCPTPSGIMNRKVLEFNQSGMKQGCILQLERLIIRSKLNLSGNKRIPEFQLFIVRSTMGESETLLKFGSRKHIVQLQDEGYLYLNTLRYFWGIEDNKLRGDPFDGVAQVARGHAGTATPANAPDLPIPITNWTLRIGPAEPDNINIFCMYALRPSAGSFPIDERNFDFGKYAIILTDAAEFMERITLKLKAQGVSHKANLVEYVDDIYTGELGLFRKFKKFSYQSEWRLVCFDGLGSTRSICLGSIRDISIVMPSNEVNDWLGMCS